jgi:hypothetical protein
MRDRRALLILLLVAVGACGLAAHAAGKDVLYSGGSPVASQAIYRFGGWGSGSVEAGPRDSYLVVKTSGYYEGGRFDVRGATVEDTVTSAKDGFLLLSVKIEQATPAAGTGGALGPGIMGSGGRMGSGGMGPGGMGPGGMGPGGMGPGGMGPGGMGSGKGGPTGMGGPGAMGPGATGPGGMGQGGMGQGAMGPGAMGQGGYGAAAEVQKKLERMRVVLVTDKGEYSFEGVDVNGLPTPDQQWSLVPVAFKDLAHGGTLPSGEIKQIRVFGDGEGTIQIGAVRLFQEDPEDVVKPTAPKDATYQVGEPFDLKASVDDPSKPYRIYWDFNRTDGVTLDSGVTGDKVDDAQWYFPQPGTYGVTVIAVPVGNRALPRTATCTVTISAPPNQGGMGTGGMGPGGMGPGGAGGGMGARTY